LQGQDREPIAISALQHAVYCLRQAALIHLEQQWAENRFTAEGRVAHEVTSLPGQRQVRGVRRVHALPLASQRLGVAGVADIVEFRRDGGARGAPEIPYPVEIKRGQPKLHRADEVQLAAQALCLEEMTGQTVPAGALFYLTTRRRLEVPIDPALRQLTEETIAQLRGVFDSRVTPVAVWKADRCRACSLLEICRPKVSGRSVLDWRRRQLDSALEDGSGDDPSFDSGDPP
jgi:CRISPR-associated exonuclease Cas4